MAADFSCDLTLPAQWKNNIEVERRFATELTSALAAELSSILAADHLSILAGDLSSDIVHDLSSDLTLTAQWEKTDFICLKI